MILSALLPLPKLERRVFLLCVLFSVLDVGDDTVPLRSLSVCTGWSSTFEVKTFKNLDHMFIFGDGEFNSYIQVAFGKPKEKSEVQEASERST